MSQSQPPPQAPRGAATSSWSCRCSEQCVLSFLHPLCAHCCMNPIPVTRIDSSLLPPRYYFPPVKLNLFRNVLVDELGAGALSSMLENSKSPAPKCFLDDPAPVGVVAFFGVLTPTSSYSSSSCRHRNNKHVSTSDKYEHSRIVLLACTHRCSSRPHAPPRTR